MTIPAGYIQCSTCRGFHRNQRPCPHCRPLAAARGEIRLSETEVFDAAAEKVTVERQLQQDAMKWLMLNGAVGICWSRMDKPTSNFKGQSDFVFCWRGRYVAAEAKVGKRKTTKEQDAFIASVNDAGGLAFVFRSVDDLKAKLAASEV